MNALFVATALTLVIAGAACSSDTRSDLNGARAEALIERCIGGRQSGEEAQRFIGMAEPEVRREAEGEGLTVRVLGEDQQCLARTDDLQRDRLNILLVEDYVVWAGVF